MSERAVAPGGKASRPRRDAAGDPSLAWLHGARFLTTASRLDELPVGERPEIAFVGRSNAGKSTAINALTQHRQLAFASRTPGRTQHVNLFELGPKDAPDAWFADLPGYGYAAVERAAKQRWQETMADYLAVRRNLSAVVLLVDSRHGFTDLDRRLLDWIAPRLSTGTVALLALLTKADKLSRREADAAARDAGRVLEPLAVPPADLSYLLFSSTTGIGLADAAGWLRGVVDRAPASMPAPTIESPQAAGGA